MNRRLALFLALSAMAHGTLVTAWPGPDPMQEWAIPTAPLRVAIGAAPSADEEANSVPRARARAAERSPRSALVPRAAAPVEAPEPVAPPGQDAARSAARQPAEPSTTDAYTNQLHSAIRTALDRYFYYPALARRQGWQGRVEVALRVEHDGRIRALHVAHSSGYPVLDRDAITTLNRIGVIPQLRDWLGGQSYDTRFAVVYRLIEG